MMTSTSTTYEENNCEERSISSDICVPTTLEQTAPSEFGECSPDPFENYSADIHSVLSTRSSEIPRTGLPALLLQTKLENIERYNRLLTALQNGARDVAVQNLPIELYVELTMRCNLDCPMCSHKLEIEAFKAEHPDGNALMDLPKSCFSAYRPLLDSASMVYTVGVGEPTLHPDLDEFVRMCADRGTFIWTNTNGTKIDSERARALVDAGVTRLVISASGGTKESYERYHKGATWRGLWQAIEGTTIAKLERGARYPEVFINFVAMDDNVRELPNLLGMAAPFDITGVTVKPTVNMKGVLDTRDDAPKAREYSVADEEVLARSGAIAAALGIRWEDHSFTESHRSDKKNGICMHPFSTAYVNPQGNVYPCGPGEALCGDELIVGNIHEEPLDKIWFGEKIERLRKRMINRDLPKGCEECIDKQLCRLHNDVACGLDGLIHAAVSGSSNLSDRTMDKSFSSSPEECEENSKSDRSPLELAKRKNYRRYIATLHRNDDIALNTPLEVFLESSNACNLNCKFCAIRGKHPRPRGKSAIMEEHIMRSIEPYLDGAASISLHGFGEPLLNKQMLSMAGKAAQNQCNVEFFTNGKMLTEEKCRSLVENRVPRITISISTADAERYEFLYENGKFDKLMENLTHLRDEKRRCGSQYPIVTFNSIVMASTINGLPDLVKLAADMDVSKIELKPMVTYDAMPEIQDERITYDPKLHNPILQKVRELGRRYGIEISDEAFLSSGGSHEQDTAPATGRDWQNSDLKLDAPCPLVFRTMYIRADGSVKPCCFASDESDWSLGNVATETVHEIWNGSKYRALRRAHLKGTVPPTCAHCVKFGLAPQNDAVPWWLAERGINVFNFPSIDRKSEAVQAPLNEFRKTAQNDAAAPTNSRERLGNLLRSAVGVMKAVTDVTTTLQSASEQFPTLQAVTQESTTLIGNMAAKAKEAGTFMQRGEIAQAIRHFESDFNKVASTWPEIRSKLDQSIAEICMNNPT